MASCEIVIECVLGIVVLALGLVYGSGLRGFCHNGSGMFSGLF